MTAQRARRVHRRMFGIKCLCTPIGGFVVEMRGGVRGLVDMRLGAVRRSQHDLIAGIDDGHRGHDRLVEVLAGGPGTAALNLDPRGVRTDDNHFSLAHRCLPLDVRTSSQPCRRFPAGLAAYRLRGSEKELRLKEVKVSARQPMTLKSKSRHHRFGERARFIREWRW